MAATNVYSNATYMPPVGYVGNFNEQQLQVFNELKTRLKLHFEAHRSSFKDDHETRFDDVRIARFLRARGWSVEKALEMIVTDINWRDQLDIKKIVDTFPSTPAYQQLYDYWPAREHGKDRYGIEAWWERIALVDAKSFIENVKHEDLMHFHIVTQEANERRFFAMRDGIRHQEGGTFVFDLQGLGFKHLNSAAMNLIKELSSMDEAHYPEMVRKIYITNAPSIFGMFYRVISPWLDKHTAEKIDIISHAKETLTAEFGTENLPTFVGGACVAKIPNGGAFKGVKEDAMANATPVTVKDYFEIDMEVVEGAVPSGAENTYEVGSLIAWNFVVESHDMGFVIYFVPKGGNDQERRQVQEYARLGAHEGSITTDTPGRYIFHWDNSFSLWRKKAMLYELFVEPPVSSANSTKQSVGGGAAAKPKDKKDKKEKKDKKDKKDKDKKSKDKKHKRTTSTS